MNFDRALILTAILPGLAAGGNAAESKPEWKIKQVAPVVLSYEVTVVMAGGKTERLSDLNGFRMAQDPRSAAAPPAPGRARTGRFSDYDSLLIYYVGYGGNNNTTTRFRRYDGTAAWPLLPEHGRREKKFRLGGNRTHRLRLVAQDGVRDITGTAKRYFRSPIRLR